MAELLSDADVGFGAGPKLLSDEDVGFKAAPKRDETLSTPYSPDSIPASIVDAGGQSQVRADVNSVAQGLVGGTGGLIAGAGRMATAADARDTAHLVTAMGLIDKGDTATAMKPLTPIERGQLAGYIRATPDARVDLRAGMMQNQADLASRPENAATRAGSAVQDFAKDTFPVAPENEGIQTGVGRMIGGVGPALLATAAGTAAAGPVGGALAGAATIGAQTYDSTYQDAIGKGATPEAAEDAAGKSAAAQALTMTLPVGHLMRVPASLREGLAKTLVNLGLNGVEFGSANAVGTFANNYVARQTYDPERPLTKGVGDAALEGAIAGLIIPGVNQGARALMRQPEATIADIGKAPDIDTAISAAQKAFDAPAQIVPLKGLAEGYGPEGGAPQALTTEHSSSWKDLFASRRGAGEDRGDTGSVKAAGIPRTSAEAKEVASAYYEKADRVGGTLTPEFTNDFIDKAERIAPQTSEGQIITGESPITALVDRIQGLRDEPISLRGAQEIDEGLGNLIDREFGVKGLSKEGKHLFDLQTTFRNMILEAGPEQTTGGTEGFEALKQGRAAWSQAMKMADLERILDRAELTDNPATSIRSGIRVLLSNPNRVRGYSAAEVSALKDAANRGVLGGILHVFGSRLIPIGAGAIGMAGGPVSAAINAGIAYGGAAMARNAATSLQTRRIENAKSVLGSRVPEPP